MKQSLQTILLKELKYRGEMTYNEVEDFIKQYNLENDTYYKMKTVERELNPSRTSEVKTLKNDKHFIRGYRYVGEAEQKPLFKMPCYC